MNVDQSLFFLLLFDSEGSQNIVVELEGPLEAI